MNLLLSILDLLCLRLPNFLLILAKSLPVLSKFTHDVRVLRLLSVQCQCLLDFVPHGVGVEDVAAGALLLGLVVVGVSLLLLLGLLLGFVIRSRIASICDKKLSNLLLKNLNAHLKGSGRHCLFVCLFVCLVVWLFG